MIHWPMFTSLKRMGATGLLLLVPALTALAADKSGVSPNAISVPKGPGSIEGLGESFQPSLNTGTAKYGLAIKIPPGVAGHQPNLGLRYKGGGGNGPLSYGWSLSLPHIHCTWDFLNRLVAVEDDTMRADYRYDFTGRRIIKRVTPRQPPSAARASASLNR